MTLVTIVSFASTIVASFVLVQSVHQTSYFWCLAWMLIIIHIHTLLLHVKVYNSRLVSTQC
jgi:hypothetical protein